MGSLADRLNQALGRKKWSIRRLTTELAKAYPGESDKAGSAVSGSSYGSVHGYVKGGNPPPLGFIEAASAVLGVRPSWLAFGEGPATADEVVLEVHGAVHAHYAGEVEITPGGDLPAPKDDALFGEPVATTYRITLGQVVRFRSAHRDLSPVEINDLAQSFEDLVLHGLNELLGGEVTYRGDRLEKHLMALLQAISLGIPDNRTDETLRPQPKAQSRRGGRSDVVHRAQGETPDGEA